MENNKLEKILNEVESLENIKFAFKCIKILDEYGKDKNYILSVLLGEKDKLSNNQYNILRREDEGRVSKDGNKRYYSEKVVFNSKNYYLFQDWNEMNRKVFLEWVKKNVGINDNLKYKKFKEFLKNNSKVLLKLTYKEIENIIGEKLPNSAYDHIAYLSNGPSHPLPKIWGELGYKKINGKMGEFIMLKKAEEDISEIKIDEKKYYHNRIIYGAPGTGKSFKLKEEVKAFTKKELIKINENIEDDKNEINYWLGTCGENNYMWGKFLEKNRFGVAWDDVIGTKEASSQKELEKKVKEYSPEEAYGGRYLWYMSKLMKKGDYIIIRKGLSSIVGYGIITGSYDEIEDFDGYIHSIPVKWTKLSKEINLNTYNSKFPRYTLSQVNPRLEKAFREECLKENELENEYTEKEISTIERVTFYDGYTYGQFVGTYKPTPMIKEDGTETITYKYVPGPFMKQLVKAYNDEENDYCLVIEEINRAKADRVFGNIFQLLDRDKGKSEYPIAASEDQLIYLKENLIEEKFNKVLEEGLYIPKNLYLWATMNSADQGVYPMDSAFKRRWSFEHIGLNENEYEKLDDGNIPGICFREENETKHIVSWNNFRKVINKTLLENKVLEDRLLAPYFIKKESFNETLGSVSLLNETVFIDKILMYLFDDILKHKNNNILFKDNINSFSQMKDILKGKTEEKENITVFNEKMIIKLEEAAEKLDKKSI